MRGPLPPPPRIDVVAAAIVDDVTAPTVLLSAQRTEPPHLAGCWEFPGGKIDPGEEAEAALHREIREEIGVQVALGAVVPGPQGGWWPLGEHHRMCVRLATVTRGIPAPIEDHAQVRWLTKEELWSVPWLASNRPIVAAVAATLWDI